MAKVFLPMKSMPHCIRSLEYEQRLYGPLRTAGRWTTCGISTPMLHFHTRSLPLPKNWSTVSAKAARSLDALPGRHPVVDWEPWQSMGMHRFTVEDFLLFYLIDQSTRTVTLVRIVYGGRDLQNLAK